MSPQMIDAVLQGGYHVGLLLAVCVLWRRVLRVEKALAECLQSGGKIGPANVDALDDV